MVNPLWMQSSQLHKLQQRKLTMTMKMTTTMMAKVAVMTMTMEETTMTMAMMMVEGMAEAMAAIPKTEILICISVMANIVPSAMWNLVSVSEEAFQWECCDLKQLHVTTHG